MNYRKLYKDYYGIDFDDYFEVHHFEMDKNLLEVAESQVRIIKIICLWFNFKFNLDNYKVIGFQALPLNEKIKTEIKEHINARW